MKRYDPICTSPMMEKPDGQYIKVDDIASILEALSLHFIAANSAISDLQAALDQHANMLNNELETNRRR